MSSYLSYLFECGVLHVLSSSRFYHNLLRDRWNQLHTFFIYTYFPEFGVGRAIVNNYRDMRKRKQKMREKLAKVQSHTKIKSIIRFILVFLPITMISCRCFGQHYGQNLNFSAFDTNGPMGKCLFPINENGEDEIKEVILFPGRTPDEISERIKKWAYEIKDNYNLKIT